MSEKEHTPTPWRTWDVIAANGSDEYPEASKGDLRIVGSDNICVGIIFGGNSSLPEADKNAAFIVDAVNGYTASTAREAALREALEKASGYMTNAAIDLQTGAPKRTALNTIEGGLKMVRDALAQGTPK